MLCVCFIVFVLLRICVYVSGFVLCSYPMYIDLFLHVFVLSLLLFDLFLFVLCPCHVLLLCRCVCDISDSYIYIACVVLRAQYHSYV